MTSNMGMNCPPLATKSLVFFSVKFWGTYCDRKSNGKYMSSIAIITKDIDKPLKGSKEIVLVR